MRETSTLQSGKREAINLIGETPREDFAEKLNIFDSRLIVHDAATALESSVPSGWAWAARASVIPGEAVYLDSRSKPTLGGSEKYLRSCGIGPKETRFIDVPPNTSLLRAFLENNFGSLRGDDLRNAPNVRVSLFGQSDWTRDVLKTFADERGVSVDDIEKKLDLPPHVAVSTREDSSYNDKVTFREQCPEGLNVQYMVFDEDTEINDAFRAQVSALVGQCTRNPQSPVVAKVSNLASGYGVHMCESAEDAVAFIEKSKQNKEKDNTKKMRFVIEENVRNPEHADKVKEMSAQFFIEDDGTVLFLCATRNIMGPNEKGHMVKHYGNLVATDPNSEINTDLDDTTKANLMELGRKIAATGARGYFGVDLMKTAEGEVKAIEVNLRNTGATYPAMAMMQLAVNKSVGANGDEHFVVLSDNRIGVQGDVLDKPSDEGGRPLTFTLDGEDRSFSLRDDITTFEAVAERLQKGVPGHTNDIFFQKGKSEGVIPYLVGTLPIHIGILVVAKDAARANELQKEAYYRLMPYKRYLEEYPELSWISRDEDAERQKRLKSAQI